MAIWTKEQIIMVIETGRPLHFVDSAKKVKEYYDKKMYALERDSPIIKELLQEGKLTVDKRILKLQEGYYHIIDVQLKDVEFKSETRQVEIAYALYKKIGDKEYRNKIYQIKVKPLTNNVSEQLFGNNTLQQLINKTICISKFELDESSHSYKVNWFEMEDFNEAVKMAEIVDMIKMQEWEEQRAADEYLLQCLEGEIYDEPDFQDDFIEEQFEESDFY